MADPVANMAPCLSQFVSAIAKMKLSPEFSRGFGLGVKGTVAAGFNPSGFPLPGQGPGSFGVVQSDATWGRGATIRVAFLDGNAARKSQVEEFASLWHESSKADFKFQFGARPSASDVRVTFRGQGFKSLIGKEANQAPGQPTLTLGFANESEQEVRRLVLHEFGHALGFMHEHKHPEGGIQWDKPRAVAYYKPRLPRGMPDEEIWAQLIALPNNSFAYKFFPFDPRSIMLYSVPVEAVVPGTWKPEFGNHNTALSADDLALARSAYGGPEVARETRLELGTPSAEKQVEKAGQVDLFTFTAPASGTYEITSTGTAILHVDLTDEDDKPTFPNDRGEDSVSPQYGVYLPRYLAKGKYRIKVTANRFASLAVGAYSLLVKLQST